ncbi:MAG: nitroreductase [Rhodospirillales bacterium]|nr:nitroreductase [Rhodospirillales bacterium]MBN8897966.1 nitroreductase [Rhodospirillales bacterium]
MDALECLLTRDSAGRLTAPGPDRAALETMLQAAVRAPDHGRLRPWRFLVIETAQREAFGEVLASSLRRREPDASPEALQREREKALRAPVILVVAAHLQHGHKIPVVEQLAAVSAAAQTVLLAAHAQGWGAVWKTGAPAYDAGVRTALGFGTEDEIVGFLYLGTKVGGGVAVPRPPAAEFTRIWQG